MSHKDRYDKVLLNNKAIRKNYNEMAAPVFLHSNILASTLSLISFKDLPALDANEHEIQIRGFAYRKTDGQWILSPDPALKSCCVGSKAKAKQQIAVIGDITSLSEAQAVVVQGNLHTHTTHDMVYYTLSDAQIISETTFPWLTLGLIFGTALLFGAYSYFLKKTH